MGEKKEDRLVLLLELSSGNPHPESVPVNMLMIGKSISREE